MGYMAGSRMVGVLLLAREPGLLAWLPVCGRLTRYGAAG